MAWIVSVSSGASLLALLIAMWALMRSKPSPSVPAPSYDDRALRTVLDQHAQLLDGLQAGYEQLEARFADVVEAVDEGVREISRKENRIRATVRRAREELEAEGARSPALDAEALELQQGDGGGGGPQAVPAVPAGLGRFNAYDLPGDWRDEDVAALMGDG